MDVHSCVVHTLQLFIGKDLAPVEILAACVKGIINFFSTQKQIERLEAVQRKLGYEDVMHCIQDVQTCWNSSYYAWNRLFYLKNTIIQLQTNLYTSTNREDRKDATNSIDSPSNDVAYNNKNTIFEETELEVDSEEIISHIIKKRISIKDLLNTEGVLLKELDLELENKKDEIIQKLHDEFNEMNSDNLNKSTPVMPVTEPYNTTVPVSDAETSL
ncbi:hypothetical protein RclHR1_24100003 [Rhizophagus clarus]|uniref:Uncharacterized protein n=1 Tax=Rhizophagus clarus TaxID=94130 RepID=A0A2Z6RRG1_9GLOM|nr:hypothetical protein RclHR1_24100003 [Rhizophagus clarus]